MKQTITLKGAPDTVKKLLEVVALTKTIIELSNTHEINVYSAIVDDSASLSQVITMISGDASRLKSECDSILAASSIDLILKTDQRPIYLVVSH